jgi:carotenoid cleavage dioxygenase-like enzyme
LSILPPETGKSPLKKAEVLCTVPCRSLLSPSYYHSFGMTDNYFIFIEQPFKLDILKMATAYMRGVNWASCLKHCPEENVITPQKYIVYRYMEPGGDKDILNFGG